MRYFLNKFSILTKKILELRRKIKHTLKFNHRIKYYRFLDCQYHNSFVKEKNDENSFVEEKKSNKVLTNTVHLFC